MKIWIVNYYTGTPENAGNPRYIKLAHHFIAAGHEVITFNASLSAGTQKEQSESGELFLKRNYGEYHFVHVNVPTYNGNGIKRMYSIWKFAQNILKCYKKIERPDVILHNIHPPFDYPIVKLAKRLKCKYITEAWDLWPDAFVYMGWLKASNPIMKWAYSVERKYYYAADEVVFTFLGAFDYLKRQGWMKEQGGKIDSAHLHYINNGVDLEQFDQDKVAYPRQDEDMNDESLYRIVYLGSINVANHVKTLVDAAALLRDNPKYRFFIYGNGAYRDALMQYAKENHIDNVVFKEKRISLAECAWVVSQAKVGVMNYEKGFGRMGVSSGKMFQYLAAGKPIVCNVSIGYDDVITDNNIGIAREMERAEDFAKAIKQLAEQPDEEYKAMCKRVRKVAEQFDYKILAAKELELLNK